MGFLLWYPKLAAWREGSGCRSVRGPDVWLPGELLQVYVAHKEGEK